MRFTPHYTVSYHGKFYPAGKPFEVAEKDAAEMSKHGTIEVDNPPVEDSPHRRGRPKKGED